jgi:hypothetical protein
MRSYTVCTDEYVGFWMEHWGLLLFLCTWGFEVLHSYILFKPWGLLTIEEDGRV